jgi:tetratricopeptide (TPR) repeat protein
MDIKKNTHGESHPQYAMALNNVGLVQYSQEKYDQAIKYFREAKTVMELGNHKNIYYASFVSNIADAYQMLNETDSSQKYYDQTIALKRKYVDAGNRDYLLQINEIANMQYTKGNYKEALELYKEAAEKELLARKVTADYRIYLRNMALAYKELQQIDDEIKIMEKAAEAQKELFGENSSEYAYDLNEVAHLYYAHPTSATKAANFYIKSANIEKELNGKSPNYIIYIRNLGYLQYNILKDYIAARKTFEELIQLQQQKEMTTTTTYAADLSYLGMTYYEEKNPKGIAYLEESKKIYQTLEGESLDYTNAVQNIALFYSEQLGDFVKAEVAQIALCALRKKQYAEDSNSKTALQEYTDALRFLSYSQIMNNKMAEAEKNTTEGLKLSMNNIRFEVRLAFIYCFTNRFEKGQAILLKYKEKEYPSNDADKILSKEIYQDFYKDMLKTNLNKQILEKIKQVIE